MPFEERLDFKPIGRGHAFCDDDGSMKTIYIPTVLAALLLISNCRETEEGYSDAKLKASTVGDVTFARRTFEALAKGESSVADKIDWPVFTMVGTNVGASYSALASAVEKEKFTNEFITQFALNFRQTGGVIENLTNWRVASHDALKTEVAADSPNGVITIVVAERDGVERVSSISVIK
jgi:hypothetical protein